MRRTPKLHMPLLAHHNWQKLQIHIRTQELDIECHKSEFYTMSQFNLYTDRYNLLLKISCGPSGGPWTRVVYTVVHGPGSMFCVCLFPCTCIQ